MLFQQLASRRQRWHTYGETWILTISSLSAVSKHVVSNHSLTSSGAWCIKARCWHSAHQSSWTRQIDPEQNFPNDFPFPRFLQSKNIVHAYMGLTGLTKARIPRYSVSPTTITKSHTMWGFQHKCRSCLAKQAEVMRVEAHTWNHMPQATDPTG